MHDISSGLAGLALSNGAVLGLPSYALSIERWSPANGLCWC